MSKITKASRGQHQGKKKLGGPRSAARLAAVQALYQIEMTKGAHADTIVTEYINHRLGAEVDGHQYVEANVDLFSDITKGAWGRVKDIDSVIASNLVQGWTLDRIESILRAILRAGLYEIIARPDVPTAVIINEYVDVAHAFLERPEVSFVNSVLDKAAKANRS